MRATITKRLVFVSNADDPHETIRLHSGDEVTVIPNEHIPNARVDVTHEDTTVRNVPREWFAMVSVYRVYPNE